MKSLLHLITLALFLASCSNDSKTEADFKLIPVKSGQYWGYVDHDGKIVINPQFGYAQPFYEGLALIRSTDGKYGYIDDAGKYIINPTYKEATNFENGLALVVKENSKLEFINKKGETKIALDATIEKAHNFSEGLALINMNDKYGYIDDEGKTAIPATFAGASDFSEGLAKVAQYDSAKNERKYGFINKKGDLVITYQFLYVSDFKEGMALVNNGTKSGYINTKGEYVINPQFDNVSVFNGEYAALKQGELWGFIDKKGKIVINPQYKSVDMFYNNDLAAVVSTDGKTGFIDKDGKYVINPQFDYATRFYNDMSIISTGGKYGLIDKKGKITMNPQFDAINKGSVEKDWVNSDFFDISDVVSYISENLTGKSFNGFSSATSFKDLKVLYPNLNENNYYSFTDFIAKPNRFVQLKKINPSFVGGLTTSTDNYTTQQVYDPVAGGYTTQKVYAGSTSTANPNARLYSIGLSFSLSGKARSKKPEIVKALYDKFKGQGFTDVSVLANYFSLSNKTFGIACNSSGENYDISIDIDFSSSSNNSAVVDTVRVMPN